MDELFNLREISLRKANDEWERIFLHAGKGFQSSKCGPLSLETPLSKSFQFRQLICKLSKIRQEVKNKLGFE
jgi:hypothetical protein